MRFALGIAFLLACEAPTPPVGPIEDLSLQERIVELYESARESGEDVGGDAYEWAREDVKRIGDWEYRVVRADPEDDDAVETQLNQLGEERWELVWIERDAGGLRFVLKRPTRSYLRHLPLSELRHLAP